jgi:intracellular septation protein
MFETTFNEPLHVPARAWLMINSLWVGWFALLAAVNLYVAWNFSESAWVHFKVYGITPATMLFMIPQVLWLSGKTKAAAADLP